MGKRFNAPFASSSQYKPFYNERYYKNYGGAAHCYSSILPSIKNWFKFTQKYCTGGRLLDVGCALGLFASLAEQAGFEAYGVDFSEYAIAEAKKLLRDNAVCADVEKNLPFPEMYFDVVTAWDVLEHLPNPEKFFPNVNRVLKNGGLLLLKTVNHDSVMSRLMPRNWLYLSRFHPSFWITPKDVKKWLAKYGFTIITCETFSVALKPLPGKLKLVEKALFFIVDGFQKATRRLETGDLTLCVAKKSV